jgi:hypothetical protein
MKQRLGDDTVTFMAESSILRGLLQRIRPAAAAEADALSNSDWAALRVAHREQAEIHDGIVDELHHNRKKKLNWLQGGDNLAYVASRVLIVLGCRGMLVHSSVAWGTDQKDKDASCSAEERAKDKPLGPLESGDAIKQIYGSTAAAASMYR